MERSNLGLRHRQADTCAPPPPIHSCVGYRVAIAEMVLTLGNTLRCFDLKLAGPLDLHSRHIFLSHPREDVKIRCRPRPAAAALLREM